MAKHVVTIVILLCAVLLYYIGASIAATGLVVLAVLFEGYFWFRLIGPRDK
jgi:hypothetical protein